MGAIGDVVQFAPFPAPLPLDSAAQDIANSRAKFNALYEYINTIIYGDNAATLALLKSQNLGDLPNVVTARTNLGLGSAALLPSSAFDASGAAAAVLASSLQKSANLSDLANVATARTNLGLGSAATFSSTAFDAQGSAVARAAKGINADITALTALSVTQKSTSFNVTSGMQFVEVDASGGAVTVTYNPASALGQVTIIKTDATYNPVNLTAGSTVIYSLVAPAVAGFCQSATMWTNGTTLRVR